MAVKCTVRKDTVVISLKRSDLIINTYLKYRLIVKGARGVFSIADDQNRVLMKDTDFPSPQNEYICQWPKDQNDIPPENDLVYTLSVSFITAVKYTYIIEKCKPDGTCVETLKDIDYESTDSKDVYNASLRIIFT
jgi:hypothetical protein